MKLHRLTNCHVVFVGIISGVLLMADNADSQQVNGKALLRALQRGGYVIVMRHASSPQNPRCFAKAARKSSRSIRK